MLRSTYLNLLVMGSLLGSQAVNAADSMGDAVKMAYNDAKTAAKDVVVAEGTYYVDKGADILGTAKHNLRTRPLNSLASGITTTTSFYTTLKDMLQPKWQAFTSWFNLSDSCNPATAENLITVPGEDAVKAVATAMTPEEFAKAISTSDATKAVQKFGSDATKTAQEFGNKIMATKTGMELSNDITSLANHVSQVSQQISKSAKNAKKYTSPWERVPLTPEAQKLVEDTKQLVTNVASSATRSTQNAVESCTDEMSEACRNKCQQTATKELREKFLNNDVKNSVNDTMCCTGITNVNDVIHAVVGAAVISAGIYGTYTLGSKLCSWLYNKYYSTPVKEEQKQQ